MRLLSLIAGLSIAGGALLWPGQGAASGVDVIRGDVNRDGEVNSIDALLILQFEAGTIIPPPHPAEYYKKADVNQSGWVDSVDAALILQVQAGLRNIN